MQNRDFSTWCDTATVLIRYGPDRKAVGNELMAHLEDHRDALMAKGMDEETATQKALAAMGDAKKIARQLALLHRPFWGYFLRVNQILLVILLVLSLKPLWDYATDLKFSDMPNHTFDVYDSASYGGDTGRTLHHLSQPDVSFTTDGSSFALTDAVVYTEYSEYYGCDRTYLLVLIRQQSLLPWSEQEEYFPFYGIAGWFSARDSLGNTYAGGMDNSIVADRAMYSTGVQSGIFTYTHECRISDFPAEAEWVELFYERDGRRYSLIVDLAGGDST